MFSFLSKPANTPDLSAAAFVDAPDSTIVIDIREHAEVAATGKAKGAVHIPLMMLHFRADPAHPDFEPLLDRTARIAVYCASGGRAHSARRILEQLGYRGVHNIGGLDHWVQAGGELEG